MPNEPVDDLVRDIGAAFEVNGGRPHLADDKLAAFADAIAASNGRRERIAVELAALARRLVRTEQEAWEDALAQLCLLIGVALTDLDRAGQLLADTIGTDRARAVVGAAASSKIPVGGAGRAPGS